MDLPRSAGTQETIRSRLSPAQYEVMEDREDRSLANTYPFNHVARQVMFYCYWIYIKTEIS